MNDQTKPPDHPLVSELEVGDVIQTAGLDAMDEPEAVVLENTPMTGEYRYLATCPPGQPGAIKRYPQRGDITVTRLEHPPQVDIVQYGVRVKYPSEPPFTTIGTGGWSFSGARGVADGYRKRGATATVVYRHLTPWTEVIPAAAQGGAR